MQEGNVHPASYVVTLLEHTLTLAHGIIKRIYYFSEPCIDIQVDSCICHNCRINLKSGLDNPIEFQPWWKKYSNSKECQVEGCTEKASRLTRLPTHREIEKLLQSPLKPTTGSSNDTTTLLCDGHYRTLHKEISPQNYQNKCITCGLVIRTTCTRHCPNPDYI